jgi:hypothetical protein
VVRLNARKSGFLAQLARQAKQPSKPHAGYAKPNKMVNSLTIKTKAAIVLELRAHSTLDKAPAA